MELARIEKLIDKYEDATTSIKEEHELRAYFNGPNVAPHLVHYQPMFQYLSIAKQETFTKELPLQPSKSTNRRWLAIASVFVLSMGTYFTYQINQKRIEEERFLAQKTYQETKKALQLLSQRFNQGAYKVGYLGEFEQAKNQVFKSQN